MPFDQFFYRLIAFCFCSLTSLQSTSCTISGVDSDGSAGNLILDENGNLSLNGNTNDPRFFDPTTLGTAPDVTTTFENIDNFIIAPGQIVNVIGTLIVKSKRTQIDGELNGIGGGYIGAVGDATANKEFGNPGESPPDTNGHGRGGKDSSTGNSGGGGGSHGTLLLLMCPFVVLLLLPLVSYSFLTM